MASIHSTSATITAPFLSIASHLWIGQHDAVRTTIINSLQKHFCAHDGCNRCAICHAIATEQHHAVQWIRPTTQYTRELLDPLFEKITLALPSQEQFFFILEQVDFMPAACANSLLKSLEEPPAGYYFFLCAQREHTILPTIRSRCMLHTVTASQKYMYAHPLFDYFINGVSPNPAAFLTDLESSDINEQESIALLDALLAHFMHTAQQAMQKNNTEAYQKTMHTIAIISAGFAQLPMPGSSKIFWKNMYLQLLVS